MLDTILYSPLSLPFVYSKVCPNVSGKISHISDTTSCEKSASFTFSVKGLSHCDDLNNEYTLMCIITIVRKTSLP